MHAQLESKPRTIRHSPHDYETDAALLIDAFIDIYLWVYKVTDYGTSRRWVMMMMPLGNGIRPVDGC
jgi:hypothetical protein